MIKRGLYNLKIGLLYTLIKKKGTFDYDGDTLDYFYHRYNHTWTNERKIELPIIRREVYDMKDKTKLLEVGNVLSHYGSIGHKVIDKYEISPVVNNVDAADFRTDNKYDLIISISTLEHIGYDEHPQEPYKILRVIENLKKCLSKKGKIIFTVPIGYNPYLDELIFHDRLPLTEKRFLKKISKNDWVEMSYVGNLHEKRFPGINAIMVGVILGKAV